MISPLRLVGTSFLLTLFSLIGNTVEAQVSMTADKSRILIGDPIILKVIAEMQPNSDLVYPELGQKLDENVEVLDFGKPDTIPGRRAVTRQVTVTVYDSGRFVIPPLYVVYTHKNGFSDTLRTESIPVEVTYPVTAISDTASVRGIRGIRGEKATLEDYLIWIYIGGGLLLAALIGFLVWRYLKNREKPKPVIPPPPPPKPHEVALVALDKIGADQIWRKGEVKLYYSSISDTIRKYLEDGLGLKALESTSGELLDLVKKKFTEAQRNQLQSILDTADLAKFAKGEPNEDTHQRILDAAIQIVTSTIPPPPQPLTPNL